MTSLYFGMLRNGIPADEKTVRSTTQPYEPDAPAAMATSAPDMEQVDLDSNPSLGMNQRQLAPLRFEPEKGPQEWKDRVDGAYLHNEIVDRQVSTSGTAAAREAAGQWGHGTLAYSIGIAPVGDLVDGGKMGNEYFVGVERDVQPGADNTMMTVPPGYDQSTKGEVAAYGKTAARDAASAGSVYAQFLNGLVS